MRVRITGGPHDGRSLYIDELDLPSVIYSTGQGRRFEWWPERSHAQMSGFPIATDPESATVRYTLRVPDDTREPAFTADATTPD